MENGQPRSWPSSLLRPELGVVTLEGNMLQV